MKAVRFSKFAGSLGLLLGVTAAMGLFGIGKVWAGGPAPHPTLDGNLSDFKSLVTQINAGTVNAVGVNQLDNIGNGPPQFPDGFQDEPLQDNATPQNRFMHSPINVGNFLLIYSPDSDGVITPASADDSFIAVGVNIANGDGDVGDISACVNDPSTPGDECAPTFFKLFTPPDLPANIMVPFDADGNGDPCVLGTGAASRWAPLQPALTFDESSDAINLSFFLCAESESDLNGPDFSVIYQQRNMLNTELVLDNVSAASVQTFPPVNSTCASIAARGLDHNIAFPDGRGNDDVEFVINKIDSQVAAMFPGEDYRSVTRFRLAHLGFTLRSDASGDLSNEDSMFALLSLPIPEIEVKKQVRCEGAPEFGDSVEIPPSGQVEFRIEVENTGNADLAVELEDHLTGTITPNLGTMQVTLFRPGDAAVGIPVNFANAAAQNPQFNPLFFGPMNNQFLMDMQNGTRRCLGVLRGVDVCNPVTQHTGDRVVITFMATVNSSGNFCDTTTDFTNTILACGDPDVGNGACSTAPNNGNEVYDMPSVVDTPRESGSGEDDNVNTGNVICIESALVCNKSITVDFGDNGSDDLLNRTSVILDTSNLPVRLTYNFKVTNAGDLPIENICLVDSGLIAAANAAGVSVGPCSLTQNATCTGAGNVGAAIGTLAAHDFEIVSCEIVVTTKEQFLALAAQDNGAAGETCFENTSSAHGTATLDSACGEITAPVESLDCMATVCLQQPPTGCIPTKAKFDIWNENEVRFSGTERCIFSWDQEWLSQYTDIGLANHFFLWALQTNKGKARIDGLRSPVVCGDDSVPAPFLGVMSNLIDFSQGRVEEAGTNLVGIGAEAGQILYQLPNPGGEESQLPPSGTPRGNVPPLSSLPGLNPLGQNPIPSIGGNDAFGTAVIDPRADITTKGSLLVYNKVELKWDDENTLIQDTFLTIVNDFDEGGPVDVQLYFVNGDLPALAVLDNGNPPMEIERAHLGCNAQNNVIMLTHDESAYWSSASGLPKGVSPFTNLDPGIPQGRPDTDPYNPGGRVLRGYVLGWAVEHGTDREIRWNHLSGTGIIVNYRNTSAWEYNAWAFQALPEDIANGELLLPPYGQLDLNGVEYEFAPARLVFDFFAVGSYLWSGNNAPGVTIRDTHLTLWAALKDLREE